MSRVFDSKRIENGMTKIDAELLIRMSEVLHAPVDLILGLENQENLMW